MAESENRTGTSASTQRGIILGLISAVSYSAANLALRGLSGRHEDLAWSIWVTGMKALPTVLLAWFLLMRRPRTGQPLYPSVKIVMAIFLAALMMQFGGNLGFQLALGHIGLAITVPVVFALIIGAGAILGRMFLGDGISPRTVVSIVIMTVSVILLSYAATLNHADVSAGSDTTGKLVWLGVTMAVISGASYGINGVVIRRVTRQQMSVASVLIIYSLTGLISLTILGGAMMGWDRLAAIQTDEWQMMLWAGTFNAIAFFSISNSLKLINITQVNVINATQNAMCAIGAVMIFAEPVSTPMVVGMILSIIGLVTLDRK